MSEALRPRNRPLGAFLAGGAIGKIAAQVFGVVYVIVVILGLIAPVFMMNLIGYFSIGNVFAHHGFHLATVIVAGGIFWLVVAEGIKRNGVPPRLQGLERLYRSRRGRAQRS